MVISARIENIAAKKLVGIRMQMSFSNNQTGELWRHFMPIRNEIQNRLSIELYALQIYANGFFDRFDPNFTFEKWALMEVSFFENAPGEMECFTLGGGLYVVFDYKGNPQNGAATFKYILTEWLPASDYVLDNRPHFEILGAKYKNNDTSSEEEIWIPVKVK